VASKSPSVEGLFICWENKFSSWSYYYKYKWWFLLWKWTIYYHWNNFRYFESPNRIL
jgi:hypothetical protein